MIARSSSSLIMPKHTPTAASHWRELKRFDEALQSYDRAIQLKPDFAEAYYNRGLALVELKRFEEALQSYDRAIQLKPDFAEAYSNRGIALDELKRFEEALQSYDRAIQLKPDIEFLMGDFLHIKMKICDWSNFSGNVAELCDRISRDEKVVLPFSCLLYQARPICKERLRKFL